MSGFMRGELLNEIRTEISWLATAVTEISETLNLTSYHLTLLRYRVEPEEADAIERTLFFSYKELDSLDFSVLRQRVEKAFASATGKSWGMPDDQLKELIDQRITEITR